VVRSFAVVTARVPEISTGAEADHADIGCRIRHANTRRETITQKSRDRPIKTVIKRPLLVNVISITTDFRTAQTKKPDY
jgi:hypothetical protein